MGDEKMISSPHHRRYGSQQISVPFLWEHKPGMPRRNWIAKPIPFISAKFSESKQVSLSEKAIMPLKLVISVPFQWEEKPGKPIVREENPCSTIAPVAFSSWNDSLDGTEKIFNAFSLDSFSSDWNQSSFNGDLKEGDSNQNDSLHSVSGRYAKSDSSSSAMQNVFAEVEVKSCTRHHSHLVKRTLTLGELILLSRKLNYPKNVVSIRKHRFFLMGTSYERHLANTAIALKMKFSMIRPLTIKISKLEGPFGMLFLQNKRPRKAICSSKIGQQSLLALQVVMEYFNVNA